MGVLGGLSANRKLAGESVRDQSIRAIGEHMMFDNHSVTGHKCPLFSFGYRAENTESAIAQLLGLCRSPNGRTLV